MKKYIFLAIATLLATSTKGQTFEEGSCIVNAGIGVGVIKDCGPTFTQKVGIEWGVKSIGQRGTLGLGVALTNAYGGITESKVYGTYDYNVKTIMYKYQQNSHNRWTMTSYEGAKIHRFGAGTADAKFAREDLKALALGSYHHAITDNLEAYGTFGLGIALINGMCGHYDNYDGFEEKVAKNTINQNKKEVQYSLTYKYNDLDHAKFAGTTFHKVTFACALSVGARYSLTSKIAAFGEIGLVSGAFRGDKYAKGLDVFTLGVTYKLK